MAVKCLRKGHDFLVCTKGTCEPAVACLPGIWKRTEPGIGKSFTAITVSWAGREERLNSEMAPRRAKVWN
jgi:hypothetical protein